MLLSIILSIASIFAACAAAVLVAPIVFRATGSFSRGGLNGRVSLSWVHPAVARCVVDPRAGTFEARVLGFKLFTAANAAPRREPSAVVEEEKQGDKEPRGSKPAAAPFAVRVEKTPPQPPADKKELSEPSPAKPARGENVPWKTRAKQVWVFLGNASFRGKMFGWAGRIPRSLRGTCRLGSAHAHVKAGLGDPAATGMLYGWYQGVTRALSAPRGCTARLDLEPVFTHETFEAHADIALSTSMLRLCLPIIVAVVTFPYLHAYLLYRRAKALTRNVQKE
jgi:hypothetical protein